MDREWIKKLLASRPLVMPEHCQGSIAIASASGGAKAEAVAGPGEIVIEIRHK
ncbi:MAG: hypothetical protein AB7S38_24120 [Vulcanimicrobiota bacterium]